MKMSTLDRAAKIQEYVRKAYLERHPSKLVKLCKEVSDILEAETSVEEVPQTVGGPLYSAIYDALSPLRNERLITQDFPEWLTAERFRAIQLECSSLAERNEAESRYGPVYREVDSAAASLLRDPSFTAWVENRIGCVSDQSIAACYVTYHRPGQRCSIHIDNPSTHGYNCLIGLDSARRSPHPGSMLRIFGRSTFHDVELAPGRVVLFQAACTPHSRTPLDEGEFIHILSIGFPLNRPAVESAAASRLPGQTE